MLIVPNKLYFRIGEVADLLVVKPYVLRYWETEFQDIKPSKSKSGQRLYKRRDVELLGMIKTLLYEERFTIDGARKRLKELIREHRGNNDHPAQQVPLALESTAHREVPPLTLVSHSNVMTMPPRKEAESPSKNPPPPGQGLDNRKVFSKIKKDLESILEDLKV